MQVFIGGLAYITNEETLRRHFGRYCELTDVAVLKDPATGTSAPHPHPPSRRAAHGTQAARLLAWQWQ